MTLGYSYLNTPTGTVAPTLNGGDFTAPFVNTALLTNDAGTSCAGGEYRQVVKGAFLVNGSPIAHVLCGSVMLSPTDYQEDGCPSGSCTAYGHRTCPPSDMDKYMTSGVTAQATGCEFTMMDAPGFTDVDAGTSYVVNLSFQGSLINTADSTPMVTNSWIVAGELPATTTLASTSSACTTSLQEQDRIVGVHAVRNRISRDLEAHLVVSRPRNQLRLSPDAVALSLKDRHGRPVRTGSPRVHEVVCGDRATATFVYPLAKDGKRPVKAVLSADGLNQEFDVLHR